MFFSSGAGFGISWPAQTVTSSQTVVAIIPTCFMTPPREFAAILLQKWRQASRLLCLPVTPMRYRHLLKFHLPHVALLDPDRAEMLIARRRSLIFRRRHAQHDVVRHDARAIS